MSYIGDFKKSIGIVYGKCPRNNNKHKYLGLLELVGILGVSREEVTLFLSSLGADSTKC